MNNFNIITNKEYEGKNQSELIVKAKKEGFTSKKWGTFLQWRGLGKKIKKNEHGVSIFKGYESFTDKDKNGKMVTESRPLGFARVFNEDQLQND